MKNVRTRRWIRSGKVNKTENTTIPDRVLEYNIKGKRKIEDRDTTPRLKWNDLKTTNCREGCRRKENGWLTILLHNAPTRSERSIIIIIKLIVLQKT